MSHVHGVERADIYPASQSQTSYKQLSQLQHPFYCEVWRMLSKKERIDKEALFWVLMAQGPTLIAACEAVGVHRRTGRRWRQP
jgi:uncharacterized membrane protein